MASCLQTVPCVHPCVLELIVHSCDPSHDEVKAPENYTDLDQLCEWNEIIYISIPLIKTNNIYVFVSVCECNVVL